jgi:hypothetical protein
MSREFRYTGRFREKGGGPSLPPPGVRLKQMHYIYCPQLQDASAECRCAEMESRPLNKGQTK